jgi:hypothetical protein
MDFNQTRLPASVIASLYKDFLVQDEAGVAPAATVIPVDIAPPAVATEAPFQFLGNNQKQITIAVSYSKDVYLPEEQLNFLTNILQACRLNVGDVAIVNRHRHPLVFDEMKTKLNPRYLLVFGIAAHELALEPAPEFSARQWDDCHIVFCPPLDLYNNNADGKLLKSKLWLCLKQLFQV